MNEFIYNPAEERRQLTHATEILINQYRAKAAMRLRLANLEVSLKLREQELTPEDGKWKGSNVEARKQTKERTLSQDPEMIRLRASEFVLAGELVLLDGEIDGKLSAIKRIRWNTLSRLAEALYRNPVEIGTIGEAATEEMTDFEQAYTANPESLVQGEDVQADTGQDTLVEEDENVPF
jgi:hypothetical protein